MPLRVLDAPTWWIGSVVNLDPAWLQKHRIRTLVCCIGQRFSEHHLDRESVHPSVRQVLFCTPRWQLGYPEFAQEWAQAFAEQDSKWG